MIMHIVGSAFGNAFLLHCPGVTNKKKNRPALFSRVGAHTSIDVLVTNIFGQKNIFEQKLTKTYIEAKKKTDTYMRGKNRKK